MGASDKCSIRHDDALRRHDHHHTRPSMTQLSCISAPVPENVFDELLSSSCCNAITMLQCCRQIPCSNHNRVRVYEAPHETGVGTSCRDPVLPVTYIGAKSGSLPGFHACLTMLGAGCWGAGYPKQKLEHPVKCRKALIVHWTDLLVMPVCRNAPGRMCVKTESSSSSRVQVGHASPNITRAALPRLEVG